MAQKPVKKTSAKKAVKKSAPVATAKPVAQPAAPTCCGCKCGGFGRFIKKLIVFLVIFALGFAACKFLCGGKHHFRGGDMPRPEFVNGCLDLSTFKCPKMLEKVTAADANADGCITKEEFRAAKKEMRKEFRGCRDGDCPMKSSEQPEVVE